MITVRMRTSVGTLRKSSVVLLRDDRAHQLVAANLADIIQGEQPAGLPVDVQQQGEAGDGPPKQVTRTRGTRAGTRHGKGSRGKTGDLDNPASPEPGQGHLTD